MLIAVAIRRHVHHVRAVEWLTHAGDVAVCPVVEGALARFLMRTGESPLARDVVRQMHSARSCAFWADSISYADLDLRRVCGHRQVTDAYLVGLAHSRSAVLATLDERVSRAHPDGVLLIP